MDITTASLSDIVSYGEGLLTNDSWSNLTDIPVSIHDTIQNLKMIPENESNLIDDSYTVPMVSGEPELVGRTVSQSAGSGIFPPPAKKTKLDEESNFLPQGYNANASDENGGTTTISIGNDGPSSETVFSPPNVTPDTPVFKNVFEMLADWGRRNQVNQDGSAYGYKLNADWTKWKEYSDNFHNFPSGGAYTDPVWVSGDKLKEPNKWSIDKDYKHTVDDHMIPNPLYIGDYAGNKQPSWIPDPKYTGRTFNVGTGKNTEEAGLLQTIGRDLGSLSGTAEGKKLALTVGEATALGGGGLIGGVAAGLTVLALEYLAEELWG